MKLYNFKEYINEQYENNLNDNFIKWFKNSKVVDKNGNPLPVYHGSHLDFKEFYDNYTFFTDNYMNADGYANGEYIYEVYIKIKNPLIINCNGRKWDDLKTPYGTTTQDIAINVNKNKYDGIIFINIKDNWIDDVDYQDPSTIYLVFKPNQIKSIYNDGSWDSNDNNIYS